MSQDLTKGKTVSSPHGLNWDVWEGPSKLVVVIDTPGTDSDMMDIAISRYSIKVARRVGVFEEKYLIGKYNPIQVQRLDQKNIVGIVKDEIQLPVPVQPHKRQAYNYHGSIYLTLEKLDSPVVALRSGDFVSAPTFD